MRTGGRSCFLYTTMRARRRSVARIRKSCRNLLLAVSRWLTCGSLRSRLEGKNIRSGVRRLTTMLGIAFWLGLAAGFIWILIQQIRLILRMGGVDVVDWRRAGILLRRRLEPPNRKSPARCRRYDCDRGVLVAGPDD